MKKTWQIILTVAVAALAFQMRAADGGGLTNYTGTVVDERGQPVAGATVDCYQYPSSSGWFGYGDREPELQQTTLTDSNGAFAVAASQNTILMVVKKPELATAWKTFGNAIPNSTDPIVLTAPAALSGVVTDDNGQPVPGAEVWVAGANIGNEYDEVSQLNELMGQAARKAFSSRTGTDGRFRIENFPADGRAGLAVSKEGKARHPVAGEFGGERNCQPGEDIKLVVGPAGSVEGNVIVTETGKPMGGVKIKLEPSEPGLYDSEYRDTIESAANGTFHIPDIQPGKYNVVASIRGGPIPDWVVVPENNQVTVVAGETTRNVVVHFSKGALVEVTVVVTNELTPLANVAVTSGESTAYTDDNGVVLLRAPTGEGWFFASKEDWRPQQNKTEVVAGITNQVQIELTPPRRITGIVRDPSGVPVAGVTVIFHPGQYPSAPKLVETKTDADGRYEMTMKEDSREFMGWDGVIIETNFIMVRSLERNLVVVQEFVEIPTNLDLTLQPGIIISGSVKDTEGAPVTNATMHISMDVASHGLAVNPSSTNVDAQGSFAVSAIPQGRDYFLWIAAKGHGAGGGILKAGDSKTNHYEFPAFVLKRADRVLAGQVLSRDGKTVAGVTVNIWGDGQPRERNTKSDNQGHFSFDEICAGEIKVSARSGNNNNQEQGDVKAQGGDTNVVVRLGIYANDNKYLSPPLTTTGTVRDPSGAPVAGATVSLFPVQGLDVTVQTDNKGRYEITWQARIGGVQETTWLLARDLKRNLTAFLPVDEKTTNLDLSMEDGLTLSTKVSDMDGHAVTNATANVILWEDNRGSELAPHSFPVDDHGRLRIPGLPQGNKYWVHVQATNHTSAELHLEADDTKTNFLELPPSILELTDRDVSGRVLGVDGKPAAGIELQVFAAGTTAQRTWTDSDGHFAFHQVSHGMVGITAGLAVNGVLPNYRGSSSAKGGATNVLIRLRAVNDRVNRLPSNVTITTTGTVFDPSGKPAPGVLLAMLPSGGLRTPIQSDANGKYTLQWQTLFIRANSSTKPLILARDPAHNLAATGEIDTNTTSLDLHLQPGLLLAGEVRDSGGRPVTNAIVQLVPYPPEDKRATLNQMPPTNASLEGLYFFNALPQGVPYRVNVSAAGYGSSNVTAQATDTVTTQFRLPSVTLNLANQQLAGQVTGLDGKPCWGAEVTVSGDGQPAGRMSHSDASGHFVIMEVCAGALNVRAMLPASATNPRYLTVTVQADGGDTNVVLKLGQ